MKPTDTGKDKVKKICEVLRKETLEPAERESAELLNRAKHEAEAMVQKARKEAEELRAEARKEIERKKAVLEVSLKQACQQTLEALRQTIIEKLFHSEIGRLLHQPLQEAKTAARLIEAVITALEKEGVQSNLSAYIASSIPAHEVNALLAPRIIQRLREKGVMVGTFSGGVEVKLDKENITLDLSEEALKELVANYTRKDFRATLFGAAF